MKLERYDWRDGNALALDYTYRFEKVREFFEYDPKDERAWSRRTEWLAGNSCPSAQREGLADALAAFNRRVGNAAQAMSRIEELRHPDALVVTGGQQAGLFTGPLLVMYKAITIIQAAEEAAVRLNRPVIPVFWIAGEDHDFDEVNHINSLNSQMEIEKLKLEHPGGARTSISRLHIEDWTEMLNGLDRTLMDTEFKPGLMDRMKAFADRSETLTEFFGRVMAWLFGERGLVLLDSDDPELRKLEVPLFEKLLHGHNRMSRAYAAGRSAVEEGGYTPQADVSEDSVNLFLFDDTGERFLLYTDGDQFTDRRGERTYTAEQLDDMLERNPESFSNNVMTRPLMQEFLLPVLAVVLGPGEIAYWGLTRKAFSEVGMQMPILLPRNGYTLVEGTVQKNMNKFGLTFEDVVTRFEELKEAWLKEQDDLHLEPSFAKVKSEFKELYRPLLTLLSEINPGVAKLGAVNEGKILEQIEFLETRATEAHRSRFDAAIRQLDRIQSTLHPRKLPQERVFNVMTYLNKYGTDWLLELLEQKPDTYGTHTVVYL